MRVNPIEWYMENRLEYLSKKLEKLRLEIEESDDQQNFNYELLKDLMETRGRLKEAEHLRQKFIELGAFEE